MSNLLASFGQKKSGNDQPLRQGKWTREEEEYVHCLIDEFKTGMMPLAEGTSLRTFLSKMLNCHPMRISKKFVGSNYNGKQVYTRRTGADRLSNEQVKARRAKLCELERKFLLKTNKDKAKAPPQYQPQQQQSHFGMGGGASGGGLGGLGGGGVGLSGISRVSTSGVDLRNLLNQAALDGGGVGAPNADLTRNLSGLLEMPLNDTGASNSSHSLSNLFHELVNNNSTGSLDAFNLMMQQQTQSSSGGLGGSNHFGNNTKSNANSRAAAAGRALLQSGLGLDKSGLGLDKGGLGLDKGGLGPDKGGLGGLDKSSLGLGLGGLDNNKKSAASEAPPPNKPLSSFTSAELAAELRKRSSLKDIMAQLGGGAPAAPSSSSSSNKKNSAMPSSLASLQDSLSLQQAAGASNADAFSSLIRNSSMDMSGLLERQGSIDSLSNLAIRSRLQSIQSMGSLLDPLLDGAGNLGGGSNSNWTAASKANLNHLAAKVSSENLSSSQRRTAANNLMASLNSFGVNSAGSGLNLASLLNNEDALRRLESSAPSSLHQNFSFGMKMNEGDGSSSDRVRGAEQTAASSSSSDDNTAIAQFLLRKKLLEQGRSSGGGSGENPDKPSSMSEQQQLMMNVAAAGGGNGGGSGMDSSMMSSLLSSLQSNNDLSSSGIGGASSFGQQQDDLETLKRKFFAGQDGLMEQRRSKPFR